MYSKPFACRPRCCRGRFEKSCAGIGGHRGSSLSHGSGGVGGGGSLPCGYRVSDQISISVSSGPSGRNRYEDALLYIGNTKECGKQKPIGSLSPACFEVLEVGDVVARGPVPAHDRFVERAFPRRDCQLRVGGKLHVAQTLGDAHVVRVHHPGHAFAHRAEIVDVRVDERARFERRTIGRRVSPGDAELRMRLDDVVLLHERSLRELPVHGEPARVPPLGPQRLHLPRVEDRGVRLDALPQRRRVDVEVDPRAPAPRFTLHRYEVDVLRMQVVLGERPRRVTAVFLPSTP